MLLKKCCLITSLHGFIQKAKEGGENSISTRDKLTSMNEEDEKMCPGFRQKKNLEPANKYSSSDGEMLIISVRKNISNIKTEKRTGEEIQIPGRLKSAKAR